jgi:hypothetical protein
MAHIDELGDEGFQFKEAVPGGSFCPPLYSEGQRISNRSNWYMMGGMQGDRLTNL